MPIDYNRPEQGDAEASRPNLSITPISLALAESFHACLDNVARENRYLAFTEAPPLEQTLCFVEQQLRTDQVQLVVLDDRRVVGWCDITCGWQPALRHCGVLGMGLLPAYRGRGLGFALLGTALEQARRKGLHRVELEARGDNQAALALYRKHGFVQEGRKRAGLYLDGAYHDTVLMGLLL